MKILLTYFALAATLQAQGLADLARKERARQSNVESTRTLNNESVTAGPLTPSPAKAQTPATPAAAPAEAKPAGPTDSQGRNEKYWRDAFTQARGDLSRAQAEAKAAEIRLNQANKDYLQRSDIFNKEQQIGDEIKAADTELKAARTRITAAEGKIASLEDELRRSGGPAGWAR